MDSNTPDTPAPILPPEMVIKRTPVFLHKEDIERVLMDKLPGHIADISGGGQWPGCRIIMFTHHGYIAGLPDDVVQYVREKAAGLYGDCYAVTMMNKFFELFANYMMVNQQIDSAGNIYVRYTSQLNEEDTQDLQETSDMIRREINKRRAERKEKQAEAEAAAKAETDEIMRLGKLAKDQNIIEKNREYVNEIHELRNEVKKLKRGK